MKKVLIVILTIAIVLLCIDILRNMVYNQQVGESHGIFGGKQVQDSNFAGTSLGNDELQG